MNYDWPTVEQWIRPGARVLDLGCGNGALLAHLQQQRGIEGCGVEIDAAMISEALAAGLNVLDHNIDEGLSLFGDNSFDTVVMTQTLQAINYPDQALLEMLRVGSQGIVTFPNFAHWRSRWHLNVHGRMPVSEFMPYDWYNTPNIHFCTVHDFEDLCQKLSIRIIDRHFSGIRGKFPTVLNSMPNLLASHATFRISK